MFVLALLGLQAAVHAAPPMPEGHVHTAPVKVCPTPPVIPPELAGWRTMTPVAAGRTPATISVGGGVRATLLPGTEVDYPLAPAKPGAAGTSGGVFAFEVMQPGRYRVALGTAAWIDVVQAGRALPSKAHAHGPECSPVRKMVDFNLARGRYVLEVSNSASPTLPLMIAKLG